MSIVKYDNFNFPDWNMILHSHKNGSHRHLMDLNAGDCYFNEHSLLYSMGWPL